MKRPGFAGAPVFLRYRAAPAASHLIFQATKAYLSSKLSGHQGTIFRRSRPIFWVKLLAGFPYGPTICVRRLGTMERIRLVLIDDHVLFRESLGRLFASEQDLEEVVGQCARIAEVLNVLQHSAVDLLLLDFNLGAERGSDLITAVRQAGYTGKILMVHSRHVDAAESLRALQLGASGVFLKHNSPSALTKAIHLVAGGEAWLDRRIVQLLAEQDLSRAEGRRLRHTFDGTRGAGTPRSAGRAAAAGRLPTMSAVPEGSVKACHPATVP